MTSDNFWDTGMHPVTGHYLPSFANKNGNSKTNHRRLAKVKKANSAQWSRKNDYINHTP